MANKSKKSLDINGLEYVASKVMTLVNSGGTADYIVEEGTEGIWTYRKWATGIAECWGTYSFSDVNITATWGALSTGNFGGGIDYPPNLFIDAPTCNIIAESLSYNFWIATMQEGGSSSSSKTPSIQFVRPNSATNVSGKIMYHAKGLWKEFTPSIMNTPSLDLYYPVGSIYQTSNANFDPNVTFGGTWELITNKFLIGAGDEYENGAEGGSTEHTHKYGVMYHTYYYTVQMESGQGGVLTMENGSETTLGTETTVITTDTVATNNANAASSKNVTAYAKSSIGYTGKESTIPPYKAVFMWERTA